MSCSRRCGKAPDQSAGGEQGLLRREAKGGGRGGGEGGAATRRMRVVQDLPLLCER